LVVDTVYAIAQAPEVVVYVNNEGSTISTTTQGTGAPPSVLSYGAATTIFPSSSSTPSPAPSSTSTTSTTPVAIAAPVIEAVASSSPQPVPIASSAIAPASSSPPSSVTPSESSGYGVSYSPYHADGSCKTQDEVNQDVGAFGGSYSLVRIYGTSCNQTATVLEAAKKNNLKLFAGISSLSDLTSEIQLIVEAANGDWSSFDTISVGNELVNSGIASPSAVVAGIATARGLLSAAKYTGKVVTVDTLIAAVANPILCDSSDYAAVNDHPFFNPNTAASEAGTFLQTSVAQLRAVLSNPNQEVVITETGWPWNGSPNGAAVPSLSNQAAALSAIKSTYSSAVIFLSAYNDQWKTDSAGTFGAEKYWGAGGANAPSS
jgi:exo-beta-1,3-glucanase (GH17 family)